MTYYQLLRFTAVASLVLIFLLTCREPPRTGFKGGNEKDMLVKVLGRYTGEYQYPKSTPFGTVYCRLELFRSKEGGETGFILGCRDPGWASALPEYRSGSFSIRKNILLLHARRRYWSQDQWGRAPKKILDEMPQTFRLKIIIRNGQTELKGVEDEFGYDMTLRKDEK